MKISLILLCIVCFALLAYDFFKETIEVKVSNTFDVSDLAVLHTTKKYKISFSIWIPRYKAMIGNIPKITTNQDADGYFLIPPSGVYFDNVTLKQVYPDGTLGPNPKLEDVSNETL